MKKAARKNNLEKIRFVLIVFVLTGLLFSCSEGVRLLPFPPPETSSNQSLLGFEIETPYQFNAHRFEDYKKNSKSKSETKNSHDFSISGVKTHEFSESAATIKQTFDNFSQSSLRKHFNISGSGKNRAPPFAA